jgi:hypothetical protein
MQVSTVQFELSEALVHLRDFVAEIRGGKLHVDDEPELAVQLGHILDHISLAWNCKDMAVEEIGALSQSEFERLSNTVPNFLGQRVIGEFALG